MNSPTHDKILEALMGEPPGGQGFTIPPVVRAYQEESDMWGPIPMPTFDLLHPDGPKYDLPPTFFPAYQPPRR